MELEGSEEMILLFCIGMAIYSLWANRLSSLHPIFTRNNPGIGLTKLSVLAGMIWILFVIELFADPSVEGIYVIFYLVMGYTVTKLFGQKFVGALKLKLRVDVYERKNFAAAVAIAAFTLSTAMIFGGSLWGEADPDSDYEGGWWIPAGFFLMGWVVLVLTTAIYLDREPGKPILKIKRDRDLNAAVPLAAFILSTAIVLTEGVAGDFLGWKQGILSFSAIALMLLAHEFLSPTGSEIEIPQSRKTTTGRILEAAVYLIISVCAWLISRTIDRAVAGYLQ